MAIPKNPYGDIRSETEGILTDFWISNLSNLSAVLFDRLPDINWAGFYLTVGEDLCLGPFQGKPACLKIPSGRGVCGAAARDREIKVVADVHAFPGHIACDARSRSEIVLPLMQNDQVVGVLDIDSPTPGRFTAEDARELAVVVELLMAKTVFPARWV